MFLKNVYEKVNNQFCLKVFVKPGIFRNAQLEL